MADLVWLIPAFPLLGFLIILVAGRKLGEPKAGYLAAGMVFASFVVAVGAFFDLVGNDHHHRSIDVDLFSWVPVGSLDIKMAFLADPLSITMSLFVTGIAFLIHLFAIGYMHGDPKFSKFFLYLNLFVLSMTILVLGENLLVTFLGWEGVGTCSYLLISFWHTSEANASAGKKAFVTNRIGDWGFMLAMFIAFATIGTVSYGSLNHAAESGLVAGGTATAIAALLFVGATGKSAQLPLYVWLPDAMAGPTPVSALIHAATMVTAGVFLMVRMNPILTVAADWVPVLIAWVGAITALFAATVAMAQTDIKKVLAFSTVSQLGYMFLAVGSGAYVAAIFHMVTHAFFKALLFLGSGSVILGMHHEQDMRKMGALRKLMPITSFTFIIGWLAIAGVPPFAGFWSKDEILLFTLAERGPILYVIGIVTAILTAFYMTRQVIMVFFGEARWESHANADEAPEGEEELTHGAHGEFKPHESPAVMTIPLIVLAGLAVVGGMIQLPSFGIIPEGLRHKLEHWLEPVIEFGEAHITDTAAYGNKGILVVIAVVSALIGIGISVAVYAKKLIRPVEPKILADGWKYDDSISAFVGGPGRRAFDGVATFDAKVVDGAVNGVASGVVKAATAVRRAQTGNVRNYAGIIGIGVVLLLAWFILGRGIL
ncbi:MAG: NADH-quinone oxidoreductase subunit L [Ilumatobacter coccineus]|uniref:NADH-quinone oxidoreductase subunit L n=1 Tax=Ilumatobacter coccineus TaxID=467094 RepID=A0A2G6KDT9_9ACTN|nr:MAG: NADH-quinone oxidoreductase subunit L [Ilumatobacter coccineus]